MAGDRDRRSRESDLAPLRPPPRPAASSRKTAAPPASTSRLTAPRLPSSAADAGDLPNSKPIAADARRRSSEWQSVGLEFKSDKGKQKEGTTSIGAYRPARPATATSAAPPRVKVERSSPPPAAPARPLQALPQFAPPKSVAASSSRKGPVQPLPDPRKRLRPTTPPPAPRALAAPHSDRKSPAMKTPVTAGAFRMFNNFTAAERRMDEDEKVTVSGRKTLGELRPRHSDRERWDEGGALDAWRANLSPKKKGPYLVNGLASQVSDLFARTKTTHTLWQSDLSRELHKHSSAPLNAHSLRKLVRPTLRVEIVDLVGPAPSIGTPPSLSPRKSYSWASRRDTAKLVLARCRLLLGNSPKTTQRSGTDGHDEEFGLVAFSLHLHPSSTGPVALANLGAPAVLPHSKTDARESDEPSGPVSLFVPTTVSDLRLLKSGVEVWVWEPLEQPLTAAKPRRESDKGREEGREQVAAQLTPQNIGEVRLEDPEEEVGMALVCSRFAVLV